MDRIEDLATSGIPIFYISIAIGLVPFFVTGTVGNRTFTKGKYHYVYHFVALCLHLVFIIFAFYLRLQTQSASQFDKKIVLFGIYTSLFLALVVLICHQVFRNGVFQTTKEIYELDKQMSAFGIRIGQAAVLKRCTGIVVYLLVITVWYSLITTQSTGLYEYYYWLLFCGQYLVTMTVKSQFCAFNVVLWARFLSLDYKLKEVIDSTRLSTSKKNKVILVGSANPQHLGLSETASKIITLSEFHGKLYNISKRINLFYSVQILLITGKYFVEITATLYFNIQKFYKSNKYDDDHYDMYAFIHLIWAVLNAFDLLSLVYLSDLMCTTANNSKLTLHKVNLNSKDLEMKKEVTTFSLQLLHNDLVLTAAGFFNIDFTLVFNIIGAVTTYLVIFIQFDISGPSSNSNSTNANITTIHPLYDYEYTPFNVTMFTSN